MPIINRIGGGASAAGGMPEFTYTGTYTLLDDGDGNWRIKFTSSGTLNFSKLGTGAGSLDVFCVGGGGGCGYTTNSWTVTGHGGGGYTTTSSSVIMKDTDYPVVVADGGGNYSRGGTSSFTGISADGGYTGNAGYSNFECWGGRGGSGGGVSGGVSANAGVDGGDGPRGSGGNPAYGQGTTTREFGESDGFLYSNGGINTLPGRVNSGDGSRAYGTAGSSGIVVIRNHRS